MKKSKQEIVDSLDGWWREELLFKLKAAFNFYKTYENALVDCDKIIEQVLIKHTPETKITATEHPTLKNQ